MKTYYVTHEDETSIRDELVGRRVVETVNGDTLVLDNGTELHIIPNRGDEEDVGEFWVSYIAPKPDEKILSIETGYEDIESYYLENYSERSFYIFIYTTDSEHFRLPILGVTGYEGDGSNGTGYRILVRVP